MLRLNQEKIELKNLKRDVSSVSFNYQGQNFSFELVSRDGEKIVLIDGQGVQHQLWAKGSESEVHVSSQTQNFTVAPYMAKRQKDRDIASGGMISPMPGKVFKVLVEENQKVKKGDVLMILEAMKMEHAIRASSDGLVTKLMFKTGEQVQGGVVLAQIEEVKEKK